MREHHRNVEGPWGNRVGRTQHGTLAKPAEMEVFLVSEYDLKESESTVGQLYPVLLSKDGKVIDGFHRLEADKNWKKMKINEIDTEEKLLLARLVANFHRRNNSRGEGRMDKQTCRNL
jgi:hypothetical protein